VRSFAAIAAVLIAPAFGAAGEKLAFEDRVELTRGLMAEYATAKVLIPHSRKTLEFDASSGFDKAKWLEIAKESGPAARMGDVVQITKVSLDDDRIVLEFNGGYGGGKKWYRNIQLAGGTSNNPTPVRVAGDATEANAPAGAAIAILFHKPLEPIKASAVKKMLAPVLDFEKHSVTEIYSETLPPETQKAIKEKRALVGMDREQVVLALGRPEHKSREVKDGMELEDWVFGQAPGKFTFVTFNGDKVIQVKEMYAGLGTQVTDPAIK
jgi:hypothetical protein